MDIDDRHPEREGQGEGKSKSDSNTFEPPGDDFTKPLDKDRLARHREFVPEPSKHSKGGLVEEFDEEGYKKNKARLQQTINNYLDSEYEIIFTGKHWKEQGYSDNEVMRFKSNRTGEILTPHQILSEIDNLFGGGELADANIVDVDEVLYYLKYLKYKKKTTPNISFQIDEDRTPHYPGSPDSFRKIHRDRINDDKLTIPPATFVNYLDKYHREKLTKDLKELLECIEWHCYEYDANDLHKLNNIEIDIESNDYNCEGCSDNPK